MKSKVALPWGHAMALVALAVAVPGPAWAGDEVLAEALFREGRALMDSRDYAAACPKLQESYVQDPATGTLLALAVCQERGGHSASAWVSFAEVVSRAKREGRKDREDAARERLEALEPRLSQLTVEVGSAARDVPGLVVERDGIALGAAAWGTPVPVDPGLHEVRVTAPGKETWTGRVNVGDSADRQVVTVPPLADAPGPASPNRAMVASPRRDDVDVERRWSSARKSGVVVGGAGIVTLGVSGVFTLLASLANDESSSPGECDEANRCSGSGLVKRRQAEDAAMAATVTVIAGGILTASGITLFVVGGDTPVHAIPAFGTQEAGLRIWGRF